MGDDGGARTTEDLSDEPPDLSDLYDELEELEDLVDSEAERAQVREAMDLAVEVDDSSVFGRVIRGYDVGDAAEAFLGALVFGIPMFVEGGTTEIGAYVATQPVFLLATHALALGLVIGILYVADIQDVRIYRPLFGVLPRRLVGVVAISLGTATVMMTVWGRVDWSEPWLAFAQVSVAYLPMVIGATLGDILPGS